MDKIVLPVKSRKKDGKQASKLRANGLVPAVVYGHGLTTLPISVDSRELEKAYGDAGGNKIIGLKIDEAGLKNVLIHDLQQDVRTGQIIHADFYAVRMDEKIKAEIPVHLVGESTAVYQQEGTLIKNLEAIEIEALPTNLPEGFEVDIAVLDDFDKTITVGDLKIPEGVTILTPLEELIVKVDPPRSEEELAELEEPIEDALPPEEGEEAAEGAEEAEGKQSEQGEGGKPEDKKPDASGEGEKKG
ncbi:MAG TPA: 50S ribosomal protein L25 [Candidatus Dormibacteraeota bacterium]|nr:50S ribosomal protein L25 [Candidatus Dormibacteraeota bacterium]